MKETRETVKTVTVTKDVKCDKCGKSAQKLGATPGSFNEDQDDYDLIPMGLCYAELSYRPGFGSAFDGDKWCADLCEGCWLDVMEYITGLRPSDSSAVQPCLISSDNFWTA